ncbi:MAG: metallophosphoesterase family protein [Bradyrhizobiaceae bacterium]|nr:metallophosphoesterase family protein [Bradyrhizobiaceae bacterium]
MTRHIGVISDTHGLLRPQAVTALRGSSLIIHAGDVGHCDILNALRKMAPVVAVRGNIDKDPWTRELRTTELVQLGARSVYVLHDLNDLDLDPPTAGFDVVITGHTHRPKIETKDGVLYLNPGSAGPRRFNLPISVGRLEISDNDVRAEIIELQR